MSKSVRPKDLTDKISFKLTKINISAAYFIVRTEMIFKTSPNDWHVQKYFDISGNLAKYPPPLSFFFAFSKIDDSPKFISQYAPIAHELKKTQIFNFICICVFKCRGNSQQQKNDEIVQCFC